MELTTPVSKLFMIGPTYARRLEKLGIWTIEDLLYHFPFRYDDYSLISEISRLQPGEVVTIKGKIVSIKNEYTRGGKKIQKAKVDDDTGLLEITWFNQPFLIKAIKEGESYSFSGKVDQFGHLKTMVSPQFERYSGKTIHTGRLVPIYPETYGVSSKWLRSRIAPLLEQIVPTTDYLPIKIINKKHFVSLQQALQWIHFPDNEQQSQEARRRLAFDEMLLIQLSTLKRKLDWQKKILSHKFVINQEKNLEFIKSLPFELTNAQKRCLKEILTDLTQINPMNRLLEGDVGSGKTVVAAVAMYVSFLNGYQSALMAPTEILASQHYQTLNNLLTPFGIKVALLTGTKKIVDKNSSGRQDIYVGTHALIYDKVNFDKLALVVIDEQHRFGVEQRGKLINKAKSPHILTMTATPIPRTIALTLYGDLDISVIDEMPKGRIKIKTWVVPPIKRQAAYGWIKSHVKGTDEQAFIICPLIEESETLKSIKAATVEFEKLKNEVFPDLKLSLLHGRMKTKEKDEVVKTFRDGKIDILVSTPVVEVGIDIPQATIMMVEAADRFGLAQLHQLRGRVGRRTKESYCLLFTENQSAKTTQRLKSMEKIYLGLELAELDLKLRGPGEIYGKAQHGFPELKIASFTDLDLIKETSQSAQDLFSELKDYPGLSSRLKSRENSLIEPN